MTTRFTALSTSGRLGTERSSTAAAAVASAAGHSRAPSRVACGVSPHSAGSIRKQSTAAQSASTASSSQAGRRPSPSAAAAATGAPPVTVLAGCSNPTLP